MANVGEVVRVRLIVTRKCILRCVGFVEFASANEAKKALQKKNGEHLHKRKIILDVAIKGNPYFPPNIKFFSDVGEVVRVRLIVNHEGKHVGCGFLEFASANQAKKVSCFIVLNINFFKDVGEVVHVRLAVDHRGKHVGYGFVEFASDYQAKTALKKKKGEYLHDCKIILTVAKKIPYLPRPHIKMFKKVGEVVCVRLIVDHRGEHVGCGFVEFASADEAKKAVQEMDGKKIFLKMAEIAPYPFQPK
ncbi:unnamed protein product [Thlaspi arvense]|uniref:RRM domain-containing protein n=1 Tax=Thlaspi arvense TaxID=13288 RepID=A0AAU9SMJ1_THLAR|nr:unnamed protein product [Thlaspi arvense]